MRSISEGTSFPNDADARVDDAHVDAQNIPHGGIIRKINRRAALSLHPDRIEEFRVKKEESPVNQWEAITEVLQSALIITLVVILFAFVPLGSAALASRILRRFTLKPS